MDANHKGQFEAQEDIDVHVNENSSRFAEVADDLVEFSARFARWAPSESGARGFNKNTIKLFLRKVEEDGFIADVIGFSEFPYSNNNTLQGADREIEREYWFEVSSDYAQLSGVDKLVILHVHYAGKWHNSHDKRDRSTITQINLRHTASCQEHAFWKKCADLDMWREKYGRSILAIPAGGWKWEQHPEVSQAVYKLLSIAERCRTYVRGRKGKLLEDFRKRRALILAISNYDNKSCFPDLPNVFEDGTNLCKVLRQQEWEVSLKTDLSYAAMRDAIADFLASEKDEEACMFCFIGHGIGVNGNHYLVPKDARLENVHSNAADFESDVTGSCRPLQFVLDRFARKRTGRCPTAFLLDCCRSCDYQTPSQENAVDGSLPSAAIVCAPAPKTTLKNSCVIYSTSAGRPALDGIPGVGGPFMNLFTKEIQAGGDLGQILRRTRTRLNEKPGNLQLAPLEDMLDGSFHFHPNSPSATSLSRPPDHMVVSAPVGAAILTGGGTEERSQGHDAIPLVPLPFVFVHANAALTSDYIQDVTSRWDSYGAHDATAKAVILRGGWYGIEGCGARIMNSMPSILHIEVVSDEKFGALLFDGGSVSYEKLRDALENIKDDGGRVMLAVLMASNSGSEELAGTLIPYADCIVAVKGECNDQSRAFIKTFYTFLQQGKTLDASWKKSSVATPDNHHVVRLSSQPQEAGNLKFQVCPEPVLVMCEKCQNAPLDDSDFFSDAETASVPDAESDDDWILEDSANKAAVFLYNPAGTLASYAEDIDNLLQSHLRGKMSFCALLLFLLVTDGNRFGFRLGNCPERWEEWKEAYKDAAATEQALETDLLDKFERVAEISGTTMQGAREGACECKKEHTRCIQAIDTLVRNAILKDFDLEMDLIFDDRDWDSVFNDWFRSSDNSEAFFTRANAYLAKTVFANTSRADGEAPRFCGVRILLALQMKSYGVFMVMSSFALSLLFSMLEAKRRVLPATGSDTDRPFGGFKTLVSSKGTCSACPTESYIVPGSGLLSLQG